MNTSIPIDFSVLTPHIPYMLEGMGITLQFTVLSVFFGFILGTILTLCKISNSKFLQVFAAFYTSIFRGTPLLVQLLLIYYAIPQLTDYQIPALFAGVLAFSLNSAAYLSETMRAGILAVDKGQWEAAKALGVPYSRMMKDIIFPQAIRNILPAIMNEFITLLKDSSLVSVIGVAEILRRADVVKGQLYIYFEPLVFAGLQYYILVMILTLLSTWLERRLRRNG
ncbi:amino acid ABC transporter permease [Brevibacillus sp. 7WMA2]|nr:amino acid ABC transporter permease [Brevibacillus halotolerans]AUM65993.1 amino acid ABC transporter permease [Brevibacillus laterosporus]ERM19386.1 arginine ABC transporter permease [Brevibacillus laterosporus PE36]QIC05751.1 amino acid ABC transporter permease [Brevibacillus sp. 7WMA2]CCF14833.1 arginine transport system permease protein ArtQ [Brevibacillus laterosporus GI-9]AYK04942.1 amino acid ABC transporter permease [Brevibacillus laterosporus]